MNYELAKELKEAGFPLNKIRNLNGFYLEDGTTHYAFPTLSELIEACENKLVAIKRSDGNGWDAYPRDVNEANIQFTRGSTPKEAVARLWLALNK